MMMMMMMMMMMIWVVVSNMFCFHPYLGKIPILTHILQMGWFNHQLSDHVYSILGGHVALS